MNAGSIELRTYEAELPRLIVDHEGDYVVIKGQRLLHFNASFEEALRWAYANTDDEQVFVKQVAADAGTVHFHRDMGPCRP